MSGISTATAGRGAERLTGGAPPGNDPADKRRPATRARALQPRPPMSRARLACALVAITLTAGPAGRAAADPIGPALDIAIGGGVFTGDIGADATRLSLLYRIGGGVARGPWAALVSGNLYMVSDLAEPGGLETTSYLGGGVEPSIRRELTTGPGLRVHMRLGYAWRWLHGDHEVQRLCAIHGGCDGGFWLETPNYPAHGPVLAIGVGVRLRGAIWPAFGVELALAHFDLDRKGQDPDLRDTFVSLGLNIAVGR